MYEIPEQKLNQRKYTDGICAHKKFCTSYVTREMQIKTMRYHYIPIRIAQIHNTNTSW